MTFKDIWRIWRGFWFEPTSPLPVCIYRIFLGLLILQSTIVHTMPAEIFWYGPKGIIPIGDVMDRFWLREPRLDALLLFPPTNQSVHIFFAIFIVVTIFFTIGFLTRYNAILMAIGIISLHHHQPFNINGGDSFLGLASWIICFTDCGRYWSVDRFLTKYFNGSVNDAPSNPWAQRLLQVQFAIVYWQTFCCKIVGAQWLDGTAVYYATRLEDMLKFNLPFLNSLLFCKFLTWYTLFIEFAMWTFVWFKEVRYWVLLGTLILHFGIDLTINLPVFEWAFMATLILFVEPEDIQRGIDFARNVLAGKYILAKPKLLPTNAAAEVVD
jgi:hypothetical protein